MKKCNQCGTILPDDAKFCRICGNNVSDPSGYTEVNEDGSEKRKETSEPARVKRCKKCGNIVPEEAKFCRHCGSDMTNPDNYVLEGDQEEKTKEIHPVKKCNKCGIIVPDTARFCNVCGTDMRDSSNFTMVDEETGEPVKDEASSEEQVKAEETPADKTESQESVHPVKKCKICGNIVSDDMRFCNHCGSDMNNPENYELVSDPDETTERDSSEETTESVNAEPETTTEETSDHPVEETDVSSEQTEEIPSGPVHPVKKCNQCGNIVSEDAKFCNVCGADMRDSANFTMVDEETGNPVTEADKTEESEPQKDVTEDTVVNDEPVSEPVEATSAETESVVEETKETAETVEKPIEEASVENTETDEPVKETPEADESVVSDTTDTEEPSDNSVKETEPSSEQTEEIPSEPVKPVHPVKKCNQCGNIVPDGAKFCNVCGSDMRDSANFTMVDEETGESVTESSEDAEQSASNSSETETAIPETESVVEETTENTETAEEPAEDVTAENFETNEPEKPVHKVKKCNKCGNIVSDDAKFCNVCGSVMTNPANYTLVDDSVSDQTAQETTPDNSAQKTEVPSEPEKPVHKVRKCNKCGNIVPDDAKFCNVCGADMSDPSNYSMVEEAPVHKVKKCNKCGNIVPDDAKFCNGCGSDMSDPANYSMVDEPAGGVNREQVRQAVNEAGAVAGAAVQNATNAVNKAVKNDKVQSFLHNKKAVAGVIAAVAAIVVILIALAVMPKTINLADYTTINVTGYDGHGTADVTIDEQKLDNDIYNAAQKKGTVGYYYSYGFTPSYKLDKSENLSNGDTVTLNWDVDSDALKTLKIRLKTGEIKKKVSDLKKAETFDAFKGIKVKVSGAAPYGEAELNKDSQDGLNYTLNKTTGLKNGDQVKVTVSSQYDDDKSFTQYVEKYGKMPEKTTKTFVVSDLDDYITSASDLSDDVIKKMRSQAEDVIKADDVNNLSDDVHLDSLTYQGLYFLKAKDRKDDDGDDYYDDAYNKVYIVELQTFTAEDWDGNTYTEKAYTAVEFNSISKSSDGKINVDLSDYSDVNDGFYTDDDASVYLNGYETQDDLYEKLVTSQADHYTSETKAAS